MFCTFLNTITIYFMMCLFLNINNFISRTIFLKIYSYIREIE